MKSKKQIISDGIEHKKNADAVINFSNYCNWQRSIFLQKVAKAAISEYGYYTYIEMDTNKKVFVTA